MDTFHSHFISVSEFQKTNNNSSHSWASVLGMTNRDTGFDFAGATEEELVEYAKDLEQELDFYKPMFICLSVVVGCVLFFLCVLIIPARRRKKFRDMVKTDRQDLEREERDEEEARRIDDNFILGKKAESEESKDRGVGNGSQSNSTTSSRKEARRRAENRIKRLRSVSENETDGEFSDPAHPPRVEVAQMHQQQQHIYQQHQQQQKASKTYEELMLAARKLPDYGADDSDHNSKTKSALRADPQRKATVDAFSSGGESDIVNQNNIGFFAGTRKVSGYYDVSPSAAGAVAPPPPSQAVPSLTLTRASGDSGQPQIFTF